MIILKKVKSQSVIPCFSDGFVLMTKKGNVLNPYMKYALSTNFFSLDLSYKILPQYITLKYVKRHNRIEDYRLN